MVERVALPERYLIWGGGGHGKVVADLVRSLGSSVVGFADRDPELFGQVVEPHGARVVCTECEVWGCLGADHCDSIVIAIGNNEVRWRAHLALVGNVWMPPLIHPTAVIHPSAILGEGTVVMPRAVIGPDVVIGDACIINTAAQLDEGVVIDDAVHVSPGAIIMDGARVYPRGWVCTGAIVQPGVEVGSDSVIGAGAVAPRHIAPGRIAMGIPAI